MNSIATHPSPDRACRHSARGATARASRGASLRGIRAGLLCGALVCVVLDVAGVPLVDYLLAAAIESVQRIECAIGTLDIRWSPVRLVDGGPGEAARDTTLA